MKKTKKEEEGRRMKKMKREEEAARIRKNNKKKNLNINNIKK